MRILSAQCIVYALIISFPITAVNAPNPEQSIAPPGMIFELLALNKDLPTSARPKYLSPCDMVASADGKYLYVAEQTAKQIAVVDVSTNAVVKTIKLPNEVTGMTLSPDGSKLYATCSSDYWPNGIVCEINTATGKVSQRLPAGHGARSPVISPVENTLFVCNVYDNDISVIDIAGGKEEKRIKAVREPYCAAITPDGATLVVGNALPDQKSTDTLNIACKITLMNALSREKIIDLPLISGSRSIADIMITPDGKYAIATHLASDFMIPLTKIDFGGLSNHCAIIGIEAKKIVNDPILDEPVQGTGNPWGIACTKDGKILSVAHSGSNELSILDVDRLIKLADSAFYSENRWLSTTQTLGLPYDRAALIQRDILFKISIKGKAPRALTIIGNKAYTAGYFDDYIEIFDLYVPGGDIKSKAAGTIALGQEVPKTSERKGEFAFYDASLCFQKWASCHSCHPFTRPDGLNWTLRNDVVAPKNSTSMLYSWWTPPTSWGGGRKDAEESIRAGMINELFLQPDQIIAAFVDTFFMNLKPVPSPCLVKGRYSASALRGREIYSGSKAACVACHPGPLFTDKKLHSAGIKDPYDSRTIWDTPTLIECWRTAPYGHLGSFLNIKEMIDLPGMGGVSAKLTQDEINDLVEFVLSL